MLHNWHRRPNDLNMGKIAADKSKMGNQVEWLTRLGNIEGNRLTTGDAGVLPFKMTAVSLHMSVHAVQATCGGLTGSGNTRAQPLSRLWYKCPDSSTSVLGGRASL